MRMAAGPDPVHGESRTHSIRVLLGSALAYGLAAWIGDRFCVGTGYASPISPAAGIALACALVWGARVVPALALGSFLADLATFTMRGLPTGDATIVAALFALGAAAQALAGALLVRPVSYTHLTLPTN